MATRFWRSVAAASLLGLVLAGALAAEKSFRAKPAEKYAAKQKQGDLIVAVKPFVTGKDQDAAFGKVRPYRYGVVPLLLVMTNTGKNVYSFEKMQVRLVLSDRHALERVSSEDLATINPDGHQPKQRTVPVPGVPGLNRKRVRKGPLNRDAIRQGEFVVPVMTPKSTASGFAYFLVGTEEPLKGASAYISGIYDVTNGMDLFYFEIPLDKAL